MHALPQKKECEVPLFWGERAFWVGFTRPKLSLAIVEQNRISEERGASFARTPLLGDSISQCRPYW